MILDENLILLLFQKLQEKRKNPIQEKSIAKKLLFMNFIKKTLAKLN